MYKKYKTKQVGKQKSTTDICHGKIRFSTKTRFFQNKIRIMKNYRFSGKQIISFPGPPNNILSLSLT